MPELTAWLTFSTLVGARSDLPDFRSVTIHTSLLVILEISYPQNITCRSNFLGWAVPVNVTKNSPRTSSWSVLREREASGGCVGPEGCPCCHRGIAPSLLVCSECNPFCSETSQRVGRVCSLSVPNVAIDRHKNLQLAASKQTAL